MYHLCITAELISRILWDLNECQTLPKIFNVVECPMLKYILEMILNRVKVVNIITFVSILRLEELAYIYYNYIKICTIFYC